MPIVVAALALAVLPWAGSRSRMASLQSLVERVAVARSRGRRT